MRRAMFIDHTPLGGQRVRGEAIAHAQLDTPVPHLKSMHLDILLGDALLNSGY